MRIRPDRRNTVWSLILLSLMGFGCSIENPNSTVPQEAAAQEHTPKLSTTDNKASDKAAQEKTQPQSIPAASASDFEAQGRKFLVRSVDESREQTHWPRFRGPEGTGVSTETGLPLKWSDTQNIAWKTAMPGPGSSSPIVFGDHVYVTCYSGYGQSLESPGEPANLNQHLVCLNRGDGNVLWTASLPSNAEVTPFKDPIAIGKHGYASSTPVADASGVYVYFGSSGAAAYTHEGKLQWHVSCGKQTHTYGSASSPILYNDQLIIHAEVESNSLIALDKATGRERWRRTPEGGGNGDTWNTPNVFEVAGRPELVFVSGYGKVAAADPRNGAALWEFDAQILRINPSIVRGEGLYFALGGPNGKSIGLQVDRAGSHPSVKIQWELNKSAYVTSPVYHEGYLYWAHDWGGIAYCVNAQTGKLIYQKRLEPISGDIYASPVVADGRIYYVSSSTGTIVLPAQAKYEVLAHNVIAADDSPFHGSPAVSGGQIFLRSNRFVYCIGKKPRTKADVSSQGSTDNRPESASRNESGESMVQISVKRGGSGRVELKESPR